MIFLIVTSVPHIIEENKFYSYSPYVREMNVWIKNVEKVIVLAPTESVNKSAIHLKYEHENIEFVSIPSINLLSFFSILQTIVKVPIILFTLFNYFKKADHIHLRCPGNIGLLGLFVQILFPKKKKTAKYAGNWDPKSRQPLSYKIQQFILSNTFLTKNIKVLVYGKWKNSTQNIYPFFTATYSELQKENNVIRSLNGDVRMIFVGALLKGKGALYAIQLIQRLHIENCNVKLSIYGEGNQRAEIENYITKNDLNEQIQLFGNRNSEELVEAYKRSHFVLLPSQSEGWPKVIAEGMFWGCVPIVSKVSCVPYMLDEGKRGVLLDLNFEKDIIEIKNILNQNVMYQKMAQESINWSREFTLEKFEAEIKLFLQ
ncbi:glycosyltransferase [Flavobacterium amnicola]|uniref:Glycosyltransferase n=1 Tax=Flavobacterium amnicola TaxID=2506422 RepID=A0A4Q1K3X4_9FLAO|nr:glycosyltransferase [Flavobacterium amnicola]RXR17743.1 glycosyltransferase [Flavobacterium amnicola]